MASGITNEAIKKILDHTLDLDDDVLKVMLVDDVFVFDPDVYVVDKDDDGVNDAHHHEIVATNYIKGFGGAGRKVASVSVQRNDATDSNEVTIQDITWSSIGGTVDDTIGMALLIKEGTSDLDSLIVAAWDLDSDVVTNGGDLTIDFAASGGNLQIA